MKIRYWVIGAGLTTMLAVATASATVRNLVLEKLVEPVRSALIQTPEEYEEQKLESLIEQHPSDEKSIRGFVASGFSFYNIKDLYGVDVRPTEELLHFYQELEEFDYNAVTFRWLLKAGAKPEHSPVLTDLLRKGLGEFRLTKLYKDLNEHEIEPTNETLAYFGNLILHDGVFFDGALELWLRKIKIEGNRADILSRISRTEARCYVPWLIIADTPVEYILACVDKGITSGRYIIEFHNAGIPIDELSVDEDFSKYLALYDASFVPVITELLAGRFSDKTGYVDLYDDGTITIGIYCQDTAIKPLIDPYNFRPSWEEGTDYMDIESEISRLQEIAAKRNIVLKHLITEEDFREAMSSFDIVLYYGHANLGMGMNFGRKGVFRPFRMGKDTILVPPEYLRDYHEVIRELDNGLFEVRGGSEGLDTLDVGGDMFFYFGCRGETYYRDVIDERFPELDFVTTNYSSSIDPVPIFRQLIFTLLRGGEIDEFKRSSEAVLTLGLHDFDILEAIQAERDIYRNNRPITEYPTALISN